MERKNLKEKLLLYVITDPHLSLGRSHQEVAERALRGGATAVQLRDKTLNTRELIEVGKELRTITRRLNALFIINDRVDVAMAVEADGVHLGKEDMPVKLCRRLLGQSLLIGFSAKGVEEARAGERNGADYLGSGPVFQTTTKVQKVLPLGTDGLADICSAVNIPVLGVGGIGISEAPRVIHAGAAGVAVVSAVTSAPCPEDACRDFLQVLRP